MVWENPNMFDRVLVVSPHTDDGELGCGGTISKLIEQGKEVFYIALSSCEKSIPPGFPKDALRKEVQCSLDILGIPFKNRYIHDFENRIFPSIRQEIFETLENLGEDIQPDIVMIPELNDTHQDHSTTAQEAIRAFRQNRGSLISYELPWNNLSFRTSFFVQLEERHIQDKVKALACYKTQNEKGYFNKKFIFSVSESRAIQINGKYAEAFNAIKIIY